MFASLLVLASTIIVTPPVSAEAAAETAQAPTSQAEPAAASTPPPAAAAAGPSASQPSAPSPSAGQPAATGASPADTSGIVVTGRGKPPPTDPLQAVNVKSYEVVQSVDRAVVGPIATGYVKAVPRPIRAGVHNILVLLDEPTVFVNFLLQHRVGKAVETLGRVALNATFGLGGLIDVAKRPTFNLPHRNNGFADTMGFYGVKQGPYLFLPLIGSTTVRDFAGRMMDLSLLSATVGGLFASPYYGPARGTMASIDDRVQMDAELRRLRDESPDGYSSLRKYYLDMRKAEIEGLHGKRPPVPADPPASLQTVPQPSPQAAAEPVPWLQAAPVATD